METGRVRSFLLLLSVLGNLLLGKCLYVSNQVSDSICEQQAKFVESGELQKAVKSGSGSGSGSEDCGWYQVQKGEDAGCAASTFFECKVIEQRKSQSADFDMFLAENEGSGRIVGGVEAGRHEFPALTISIFETRLTCGGSIISPDWVVTAAHCLSEKVLLPTYVVVAGEHNVNETDQENPARQQRKVVKYHIHEKYDSDQTARERYDIALLKVSPPFELNENVNVIALPDPAYRATGVFTICGFGRTKEAGGAEDGAPSNVLLKTDVQFVDDETCKKIYSNDSALTEDLICAGTAEGGKDSCQGDSGGPLYTGDKKILAGIVSGGKGCGLPGIPGLYTEVAYFIDWIKKYTCL